MPGFTDAVERAILDHILSDPPWTPPATLYVGLSSTTPTDAGTGFTEPAGSYARVATTGADWSAASATAPAVKTNAVELTFPTATTDWSAAANLTHFGLFDAASGGALLVWGALTTPKPVRAGDLARFAAGALVLQLGDPGDF